MFGVWFYVWFDYWYVFVKTGVLFIADVVSLNLWCTCKNEWEKIKLISNDLFYIFSPYLSTDDIICVEIILALV